MCSGSNVEDALAQLLADRDSTGSTALSVEITDGAVDLGAETIAERARLESIRATVAYHTTEAKACEIVVESCKATVDGKTGTCRGKVTWQTAAASTNWSAAFQRKHEAPPANRATGVDGSGWAAGVFRHALFLHGQNRNPIGATRISGLGGSPWFSRNRQGVKWDDLVHTSPQESTGVPASLVESCSTSSPPAAFIRPSRSTASPSSARRSLPRGPRSRANCAPR